MIGIKKSFTRNLRHKVILEQKIQVADGAGGFETTWEEVAVLWAAIDRLRGLERSEFGQVTATGSYRFRLRYYDGIAPGMRFSYDNRVFNIRSIHDINEKKRVMEVLADEGMAL